MSPENNYHILILSLEQKIRILLHFDVDAIELHSPNDRKINQDDDFMTRDRMEIENMRSSNVVLRAACVYMKIEKSNKDNSDHKRQC